MLFSVYVGHTGVEGSAFHAGEAGSRDDRTQYLHQFVLHAALDAVEDQQWHSTNMNLGVVDKFNNLQVNTHNILLIYSLREPRLG